MFAFHKSIRGKEKISVIAEIKRASPSFGRFPDRSVRELVDAYERAGATAISVVTEPNLFQGSLDLLREVRRATKLPILRKDFITKLSQIDESRDAGADAILLIARMLTVSEILCLSAYAKSKNLDVLIEVHKPEELRALEGLDEIMIGINNRDLATFQSDVRHAHSFLACIDPFHTIVVESAFSDPKDFTLYAGKIDAALIGTALLASPCPFSKLRTFTASAPQRA